MLLGLVLEEVFYFALPLTCNTVGHQGTREGGTKVFLAWSWKCSFRCTLLALGQTKTNLVCIKIRVPQAAFCIGLTVLVANLTCR